MYIYITHSNAPAAFVLLARGWISGAVCAQLAYIVNAYPVSGRSFGVGYVDGWFWFAGLFVPYAAVSAYDVHVCVCALFTVAVYILN